MEGKVMRWYGKGREGEKEKTVWREGGRVRETPAQKN